MKIKAAALVLLFLQALAEGWGYIWGKSGQVWTQANQDAATRAMTRKHGAKWIGKIVADCSGLFVWAYKKLGLKIYHGSNTIFNKYCSSTGPLAGEVKIRRGTAVFQNKNGKRGHIGLYVGGGMCVEEHGTQAGIIKSPLSTWDEWGELKDVDYSGEIWETFGIVPEDTLKKGAKGELVKWLQRGLVEAGYDIGKGKDGKPLIDGVYGTETVSAVRAFQYDRGLASDGAAGKLTMAAIKAILEDDEDGEDKPADVPTEAPEEPTETQDTWATLSLEEKVENLNERLKRQEGGSAHGY